MTFLDQSKKELIALSQIIKISDAVYTATQQQIESLAGENEHMKVSVFVDMCLDLARINDT